MDGSQKHFAGQMQPDTKGYVLYESTDMIFWKRQNYTDRIQITSCQGLQVGKRKRGTKEFFRMIAMFYTTLFIFQTNQTTYFKRGNFNIYKSYIHKPDFVDL